MNIEQQSMEDLPKIKGLAYTVWKKSFSGIELDDLIQEGVLAYLTSFEKWEEGKNDYFLGFAFLRIKGAMLDFVAKQSYTGKGTVRPSFEDTEKYVVPAPENLESYHIDESDVLDEVMVEDIRRKFFEYIEGLTDLEKAILYMYFIDGTSMIKIGEELHVNRLKIKAILNSCIVYLKRRFDADFEEEINLAKLSKWEGWKE
jgi:RNA polymerase sigma factor (sigma-70 family)